MACKNVGDTNPDIAGLGIIIAFAFQAGVSLILSLWSLFLWESAMLSLFDPTDEVIIPFNLVATAIDACINFFFNVALWVTRPFKKTREKILAWRQLNPLSQEHGRVVAGWLSRMRVLYNGSNSNPELRQLQKTIIDQILAKISDVQVINAIGLLIAALIQHKSMSLYHLHIVYDTVSFTGVSVCASLVNVFAQDYGTRLSQLVSAVLLGCGYMSFAIVFGIRLNKWDEELPGHCYHTYGIAYPGDPHPLSDRIYLGLTCVWFLGAFCSCFSSYFAKYNKPHQLAPGIVIFGMAQFPLHLYMVIAIRVANESRLEGDSENTWGFGQIVALVLSVSTLLECVRGYSKYQHHKCRRLQGHSNDSDEEEAIELRHEHFRRRRKSV